MEAIEIIEYIEQEARLVLQSSWDNSGVQVASKNSAITQIAVMLDPSPALVGAALEAGANFIISHHPLSMSPKYPNKVDNYFETLRLLIKADAWLYSAHTSLDVNPWGTSRWLAGALELKKIETLESIGAGLALHPEVGEQGAREFGFGFVGELATPLPYEVFCQLLAKILVKDSWHACGIPAKKIKKVACCPGSGSSLFDLAAKVGADVFITGDVKYHAAQEAPLCVFDVGHFCLEEEMMRLWALQLAKSLSVPVRFWASSDPLRLETIV